MADSLNYTAVLSHGGGAVSAFGGVMAVSDENAIREFAKAVKNQSGFPGLEPASSLTISAPDGREVGRFSVAELITRYGD